MPDAESEAFLSTRRSLITRLRDTDDHDGWQEFFQTYWRLIYSVAIKSGLTETEAEDVVQETVVTVAKTMDRYRYVPEKCRFKTWLMRITRMRIVDQFRKRGPECVPMDGRVDSTSTDTSGEEGIPISTEPFVQTLWDEEWRRNLIDAAMDRVKRKVKPLHYQIFYLSTVKELRASQVARTLGTSAAQVYLVKHRLAALVKQEIQRLEKDSATFEQ
ncbi:MAG: RNA polymerase sigma factor [Limisphaerales bacterium]